MSGRADDGRAPRDGSGLPVAGVDGCRAGWVVATLHPGEALPEVEVVGGFAAVADRLLCGALARVAVDMPIGLLDAGSRPCDLQARRLLGPRRSSVFPAPARATLGSRSYGEALARSRAATGKGLSVQAYNLLASIEEVEAAVRRTGQEHLTEAHPELALGALAGAPLAWHKRHPEGAAAREAALARVFPGVAALLARRLPGARRDDVADACALAWSARRLEAGEANVLGGELDSTGLRMEIAW